jgi:hypothetical protein
MSADCPYCVNGYVCPEVKKEGHTVLFGRGYMWLNDHGVLRLFPIKRVKK